jgi:hypothetical protein
MANVNDNSQEQPEGDFRWVEMYKKIAEKLIIDYRDEVNRDEQQKNPRQQSHLCELLRKVKEH